MTNELKLCFMAASLVLCLFNFPVLVLSEPRVPCYFIFGDSLVDNGNNNGLDTNAKVNYPPYGIDFPEGPTGRFSNGRTLADFISEYLGFKDYIQPFATVKDKDIMRGTNYASGGAGILPETGRQLHHVISLDNQLTNHKLAISRIVALHGNKSFTNEYLRKCIYTVGMGNNDYIQNYFAPQFHNSSRVFTPDQFATSLIDLYSQQLQTLYKLGARKIAVFGLGASGCAPAQVVTFGTKGHRCVNEINDAIDLFNLKIKPLVDDLNCKLKDAKYIAIDGISIIPYIPGVITSDSPCCKFAIEGGTRGLCIPNLAPCRSRLRHIFFDGFHPTESSNFLAAQLAFRSLSKLL